MTRRGLQRALLGGVLAVSAAASLWWMGTVPYRPRAVLDAVPEQAAWVSLHASPAARWPDLRSNSLVRALARLENMDLVKLESWMARFPNRLLVARLGSREAAVAYVPAMPGSGKPAWVIACWAGGGSQQLRWVLNLRGPKPYIDPSLDGAHPIWPFRVAGWPADRRLSVAIREGLVLAAVSTDPIAVRDCLAAAEGMPACRSIRGSGAAAQWARVEAPDRGWGRMPGMGDWTWASDRLTARETRLTLHPIAPEPADVVPLFGNRAPLKTLLDEAEGWVSVSWPRLRDGAAGRGGFWRQAADDWIRETAGTDQVRIVAALYGGAHGARIRSLFGGGIESFIQGLKVPTFLLAVPAPDPAAAAAATARLLDRVNSRRPYGLVPREAGICFGRTVTAIDGTRDGFYADLSRREQIAYTTAEGWLLLGSHLEAFEGLMPLIGHGPEEEWRAPPVPEALAVRIQGRPFSQTVGKFMAALSLVVLASESPEAAESRRKLAVWRRRLEALGEVETLEAAMDGDGTLRIWQP